MGIKAVFLRMAIFGSLNRCAKGDMKGIESLRLAIAHGGDVNAHGFWHGLTPLMRAIDLTATQTEKGAMVLPIMLLLKAGAYPKKKDVRGEMDAIEYARKLGYDGHVERFELESEIQERMMRLFNRSVL